MRLFIAEKPSLARAIIQVLPLPHRRRGDYVHCGDGSVVAWCAGHILEPVMPEGYDPRFAKWVLDDLPIVPKTWKLRASVPGLLRTLKTLLKDATRVVHAGDPDREGQLLIDEVVDFLGYKGAVDRLLIRDTNPDAVRRQLDAIEPNAKYRPLGVAALARQRADWLYGINMTRLYTLRGKAAGHAGVLSIGRVQTPVLGLVVARDRAIEEFKTTPYYVVTGDALTAAGDKFPVRFQLEAATENPDDERRITKKDVADAIVQRCAGAQGRVVVAVREEKNEPPPLPYSLADLQIDAARRLGLSAKAVLDGCQTLYETHRLTTYPRSDCSYLPQGHLAESRTVLAAIVRHVPDLAGIAGEVDHSLRSRAWNDAKVTAHHAIIPTTNTSASALSPTERALYDLIARRYVCQFLPEHAYATTRVQINVAGGDFVATGREVRAPGWRKIVSPSPSEERKPGESALPALKEGDVVTMSNVVASPKETKPPKPFTDASLMQAMVNVASFVTDARIKTILKEADGLGTPATRPNIVETLFERGYLERKGRAIVSTAVGRALIASLPGVAIATEMTAEWEVAMREIAEGPLTLDVFLDRITRKLLDLVVEGKKAAFQPPAFVKSLARPVTRAPRSRMARR